MPHDDWPIGYREFGSVWWRASVSALTGLIFSFILTASIALGLYLRVPFIVAIERAGIDFAMKWASAFSSGGGGGPSGRPTLSFVDVDLSTCRIFRAQDADACRFQNPMPPALIADFLRAAAAGGAAVVILDVEPPATKAERESLAREVTSSQGPWIIAPLSGRPSDATNIRARGMDLDGRKVLEDDPANDLADGRPSGRLRLALFNVESDPEARDGIVRESPTVAAVRMADGSIATRPSAAYLASIILDDDKRRAADCSYYGIGCTSALARSRAASTLGHADGAIPIFFSLQSLAGFGDARCGEGGGEAEQDRLRGRLELEYAKVYQHYFACELLGRDGHFVADSRYFRDESGGKIVILGSSLPSGYDIDRTPIGQMAGSEILINAIRSFWTSDAAMAQGARARRGSGSLVQASLEKARVAAFAVPFIFAAWLMIYAIRDRASRRGPLYRIIAGTVVAAIFAMGMLAAALTEFGLHAQALRGSLAGGERVDFFTPLLALGLEGYTEAGVVVLRALEGVIIWTFARAGDSISSIRSRLFDPGP